MPTYEYLKPSIPSDFRIVQLYKLRDYLRDKLDIIQKDCEHDFEKYSKTSYQDEYGSYTGEGYITYHCKKCDLFSDKDFT